MMRLKNRNKKRAKLHSKLLPNRWQLLRSKLLLLRSKLLLLRSKLLLLSLHLQRLVRLQLLKRHHRHHRSQLVEARLSYHLLQVEPRQERSQEHLLLHHHQSQKVVQVSKRPLHLKKILTLFQLLN
jgi:hypothetical protein